MKKPSWKLWEERLAKLLSGRVNWGSGNTWYNKSDISTDLFRIEAKQTNSKSYSLNKQKWEKIHNEAIDRFQIPLLAVQIQDKELIVISLEDFISLTKA